MGQAVWVQWGYSCDRCGDTLWPGVASDEIPAGAVFADVSFRRELESDVVGALIHGHGWIARRDLSGVLVELVCGSCGVDSQGNEAASAVES